MSEAEVKRPRGRPQKNTQEDKLEYSRKYIAEKYKSDPEYIKKKNQSTKEYNKRATKCYHLLLKILEDSYTEISDPNIIILIDEFIKLKEV